MVCQTFLARFCFFRVGLQSVESVRLLGIKVEVQHKASWSSVVGVSCRHSATDGRADKSGKVL